jgi:hypothetical protein
MPISTSHALKIYSSRDFMPLGIPYVALLYPFWGMPRSERSPSIYTRFMSIGADHFRMVSDAEADFFVLPFDWRYTIRGIARTEQDAERARIAAQRFGDRASSLGKRLIVFYVGDTDEELPLPNTVVFRTSLRRGLRPNEFAMTVFFEDFVGRRLGSCLPIRPKLQYPSVGFCGFAGYRLMPDISIWRKTRRAARWVRDGLPTPTVRERAMKHLQGHPSVVTDFVLGEHGIGRDSYGQLARDAFHRNLINTDYTLCARGIGNWSIRFFETLAFGRIPLFIDTESVLPYDFETDYKDYCVWVDSGEIERIGEYLVAFHDDLDDTSFADLQRACRRVWGQRLTPEGFFSNFHEHFDTP